MGKFHWKANNNQNENVKKKTFEICAFDIWRPTPMIFVHSRKELSGDNESRQPDGVNDIYIYSKIWHFENCFKFNVRPRALRPILRFLKSEIDIEIQSSVSKVRTFLIQFFFPKDAHYDQSHKT